MAFVILSLGLAPVFALAETPADEPIKTTLCEITRYPETFDGKVVEVRAFVDSGVMELPSGVSDDSCGADLKFFTPDDLHFRRMAKSKGFRKLVKDVKRNPVVEATVTGLFKRSIPGQGPGQKPQAGLALEAVDDVVVHPRPKVKHQNR
ncbi:MAG TPA: hypothetical protein VMR62_16990 [Bryobacteraceae bacterium]|nr:hypothetical protein [Bryobacteraceae bacterium]